MNRGRGITPSTLTPQKCQECSGLFERIVLALNKRESYIVKFAEIFIDINNSLHEIYMVGEYNDFHVMLLSKVDESVSTLCRQLEGRHSNILEILDCCASFKFLHYNMANLFPSGKLTEKIELDDIAAEQWWTDRFHNELFIKVEMFSKEISNSFPLINDVHCFLKAVNFTKNEWFSEYINKSSFKIFLRFYGGWNNFGNDWHSIYFHPGHLVMGTLEHAEHELLKVKNSLNPLRSSAKSYIFCLNWRCDEGLWNVLYIDEKETINNNLVKSDMLIKELNNENFYLYPKGIEENNGNHGNHVSRESIKLPDLPPTNANGPSESIDDQCYCDVYPYVDMNNDTDIATKLSLSTVTAEAETGNEIPTQVDVVRTMETGNEIPTQVAVVRTREPGILNANEGDSLNTYMTPVENKNRITNQDEEIEQTDSNAHNANRDAVCMPTDSNAHNANRDAVCMPSLPSIPTDQSIL